MGAVIDKSAYRDITGYIDYAAKSDEAEFITGGTYDDSKGYFIQPTTIVTTNPKFKTMEEEIEGLRAWCLTRARSASTHQEKIADRARRKLELD